MCIRDRNYYRSLNRHRRRHDISRISASRISGVSYTRACAEILPMPFAIGVVMLVPIIAITMHPIIERNTIRRLGTDSQFDQNPPPALTFITFVMVTDIAHASSRGSGDLQCKAHMPPISAATPVIIIERFCRNIVFHTEAPTEIRQIDRSIPIGISDKDGKPILCGQRASEYRKNSSKPIFFIGKSFY